MLTTAKRVDFVGYNEFAIEQVGNGRVLMSKPRRSASGLYQSSTASPLLLTHVEWDWQVETLHATADIRNLAKEDFGAKILFIFGDPSIWNRDVPTVAYVWTSTPVSNGTVLGSLRYRSLRYFQLRGISDAGRWRHESRNVIADFRSAFRSDPPPLKFIAVFNDNDQTGEPLVARFAPVYSAR